jgi:hypothetical protein
MLPVTQPDVCARFIRRIAARIAADNALIDEKHG